MLDHLRAILPDEISDEAAYQLSNFAMDIATALDEIYFGQSLRYIRNSRQEGLRLAPPHFIKEENLDIPF